MKRQISESLIRAEVRRIAEVRAEHPMPPPGVRAFDARRFARHRRKGALYRHIREVEGKLIDADKAKGALAKLVGMKEGELHDARTWRGALRALWRRVWPRAK